MLILGLTTRDGVRILAWLLTCLSAGQGGLSLFDNRYDVPESVRTVRLSSPNGLSKSSDNNLLGRLAWVQTQAFFIAKRQASNESLILAQSERWRRA
jgi:hypothetical protein